ncbi:DNA translocase FtsK [Dactylosporangium sp. NPDC000555]|uniref:DNA translocase FtsK n=1 Tax=Dactylosporangium sp. NPDC000555 TaxID=3154260 RepID=UPI00332F7BA4
MRSERLAGLVDRAVNRAARSLGIDDEPAEPPVAPPPRPPVPPTRPIVTPRPAAAPVRPIVPAAGEGQGATLARVLAEHGVDAEVLGSVTGPSVTTWRLRPAAGVKVEKITGLALNLAHGLGDEHVRVVPVVTGEPGIVAVEVPAPVRDTVWLPSLLAPLTDPHPLLVPLGSDTYGRPVVERLSRMPHLLVAGATGAGKTAWIHSLLVSLLSRATPAELGLLLIDPKRVELIAYAAVPHLVAPIVTEADAAVSALERLTGEMDRRYEQLAAAGVSHVDDYNRLVDAGEQPGPRLRYLVDVVDELADLMMVAGDEVQAAVVRLAQLGRAAGIHLVLATQRPSVDVVTGLIKANMPSRLAFAATSAVDSRTILDVGGAEKLLGAGDGLYLGPGLSVPRRIQGPFVSAAQIRQVVAAARGTGPAIQPIHLARTATAADGDDEQLLQRAIVVVRAAGSASVSALQRHLSIGHPRASRLMAQLEQRGVVGPADGTAPREVLPE